MDRMLSLCLIHPRKGYALNHLPILLLMPSTVYVAGTRFDWIGLGLQYVSLVRGIFMDTSFMLS